ncbi:RnfABCDGE type electron transport complex subunit D [Treponema sp.]|uniref:RnfABCDGE type electron transport complex subunit D n=1 Tax=Treponema sp. TaxID=166 RepID=UPI00388DE2A1
MLNFELNKSCKKITINPFTFASWSLDTVSTVTIVLLMVQVLMLSVTKSTGSLIVLVGALAASVLSEIIHRTLLVRDMHFHSWRISIIQGLLTGLLLPSTYNPLAVFLVVFFAMTIFRWAFGEFAESWANIVAVCVVALYLINSSCFPPSALSSSDLQSRNAALILIQNGTITPISADSAVTDFLNRTIFKLVGISIPEGYVSLLWDNGSSIPAFRFNVVTLISSLVLISLDFVDILIPAIFLFVYTILIRFVSPIILGGIPMQGDIILALLTSGTLFSTLYILQWYGTTPINLWGKIIYGITAGILGFIIIGFGLSSVGYVFTVILMNLISPCIQVIEDKRKFASIRKKVIPRLKIMKEYEDA